MGLTLHYKQLVQQFNRKYLNLYKKQCKKYTTETITKHIKAIRLKHNVKYEIRGFFSYTLLLYPLTSYFHIQNNHFPNGDSFFCNNTKKCFSFFSLRKFGTEPLKCMQHILSYINDYIVVPEGYNSQEKSMPNTNYSFFPILFFFEFRTMFFFFCYTLL